MVPLERLSEKNLLAVYYLANEMKEELEMTTAKQVKLRVFVNSNLRYYPSYHKIRKDTVKYMEEAGYLMQALVFDDVIYVTTPDQEIIFSLCIQSLALYHKRFRNLTPEKISVDELTEEQVEKLHQVLEIVAIRLSLSHPPHIIYIPLQHFPSEVQPSDLLGLLYKADKDFRILKFTNIVGKNVLEQEAEIRIVDEKMEKALSDFRKALEVRYKAILEKRKKEGVVAQPQPKKEPLEVRLVHGSQVAIEKSDEEPKYKFPHKLPRGTKWENITIQFIDDDTVQILAQGKTHTTHYREMGLEGKGGKPSVLWTFLRVLAMYAGEIKATDPKAVDTYKKQKQSLSDALEAYFGIDFDPFYPFQMKGKTNKAYRVKFTLSPPNGGFSFEKKEKLSLLEKPVKPDPFADLGSYMEDVAPVVAQKEIVSKEER